MISVADLVRACRLVPSVGPFTIRRLMFRAGVFGGDAYEAAQVRGVVPAIEAELRDILSPADLAAARRDLEALLAAEERRRG